MVIVIRYLEIKKNYNNINITKFKKEPQQNAIYRSGLTTVSNSLITELQSRNAIKMKIRMTVKVAREP